MEESKGLISLFLNKYFNSVKDYAGILTLIITTCATFLSALIRFGIYMFRYGQVIYWDLPTETINIESKNTFYNLAIYFIISLFIIAVNGFFYKKFSKLNGKWHLVITIICFILCFFTTHIAYKYKPLLWCVTIIAIFVFPAFIFLEGKQILDIIEKRRKKSGKTYSLNEQIWQCVIIFSVTAILELALLFGSGCLSAASVSEFRVIEKDDSYNAIIYETSDSYYISPCEIKDDKITNIDKNSKTMIAKENVNYTHYEYLK